VDTGERNKIKKREGHWGDEVPSVVGAWPFNLRSCFNPRLKGPFSLG
jgi:hypothetical protein